jgi:hypothetical protein
MKNIKQLLVIVAVSLAFTSCGLFRGGGGGGHCPAYGTSISDDTHQDLNNSNELRESISERM